MCSSPFDCALFGNGLLKLEDSRRGKRVGGGEAQGDLHICHSGRREQLFGISEKLLSGEQSQVKTS